MERQYIHTMAAWYGALLCQEADWEDEVIVGHDAPDGGTLGEVHLRWYRLEADQPPAPRLELFAAAWGLLADLPDLWTALARLPALRLSPEECCALLERLGFVDRTPRQNPSGPQPRLPQPQLYRRLIRLANDLTRQWLRLAHCQQTPELTCHMAVLDRKLTQVEAELRILQAGQAVVEPPPISGSTTVSA